MRIKGTVQLREIHIKGIKLSFACSVHIGILHFEHLPTLWADESAQTGSEDWNRKWVGKERGVRFRCIRPPTHLSPGHTEDIIVLPKIYEGGGSGNSFAARHSFYLPPSPLPVSCYRMYLEGMRTILCRGGKGDDQEVCQLCNVQQREKRRWLG